MAKAGALIVRASGIVQLADRIAAVRGIEEGEAQIVDPRCGPIRIVYPGLVSESSP